MMELLPLPNFHHIFLLSFLIVCIVIILYLGLKLIPKKSNPKIKIKTKEDLYKVSIILQKLAPNDKDVQKFLKKTEMYKYKKDSVKIPKEIEKEAQRLLLQKNDIITL